MTTAPMPKRKTREQLEAEILALRAALEASRTECKRIDDRNGQLRADLDDVKERLAFADAENNRLTGYLDRVAEDDTVREELIMVGDPIGEQQLVPKRKRTPPRQFRSSREMSHHDRLGGYACTGSATEKPRHWVTY